MNMLLNFAYSIVLGHSSHDPSNTTTFRAQESCPNGKSEELKLKKVGCSGFQMPLHYPRYSKSDYESMEEWKLDLVLQEYGLKFEGSLDEKKKFAMGAFLWPDQY